MSIACQWPSQPRSGVSGLESPGWGRRQGPDETPVALPMNLLASRAIGITITALAASMTPNLQESYTTSGTKDTFFSTSCFLRRDLVFPRA